MTLLELVTYLRVNILDDNGGQGVDWTNYSDNTFDSIQLRWKNEEIVSNINEAIKRVYIRTNPIKDLINISTIIGVVDYPLPLYVSDIIGIKRPTGDALKEKALDDLWQIQELKTKTGNPTFFIPDSSYNNVRLFPIPTAIEVLDVLVYRLPLVNMTWDNPDAIPELREEYLIPMLFYVASLCYLKDEANTMDPQRSATFGAMFDREFPFTSAYSNIRKARTTNRPVRYGGL